MMIRSSTLTCKISSIIIVYLPGNYFLCSKLHLYINISQKKCKFTMKICIMYFVSFCFYCKNFLSRNCVQKLLYGVQLVLSIYCLHHLVEHSIIYKKKINNTSTQDQDFFHKVKHTAGGKVDGKNNLVPGGQKMKKNINLVSGEKV